jgi:hypothetical protein
MSQAIRFYEIGGPEVLKLETVEVGEPGPGQARVRHSAPANIRCNCPMASVRMRLALLKRSAPE